MIKQYKYWIISFLGFVLLLVVFYAFSFQVKQERFKTVNFDFSVKLQDKIPERFAELMEDIAFFVSPAISIVLVSIVTFCAVYGVRKKIVYPGALLIPLFFALMIGIEVFGKVRVESPGPPFFMIKNPTTLFPTYFVQEAYSYPSGHAARALFIFGTFCLLLVRSGNKRLAGIFAVSMIGIILTISLGKVYLGHHWLSDIIGGWIIATAFLMLLVPFLFYGIRISSIKQFISSSFQDNSKIA